METTKYDDRIWIICNISLRAYTFNAIIPKFNADSLDDSTVQINPRYVLDKYGKYILGRIHLNVLLEYYQSKHY